MLTDTTFWIDLIEERNAGQRDGAHRFIAAHRAHTLEVSIITWGELAAGIPQLAELDRLLRGVRVLMLPMQIAWEASRLERELVTVGGRLGENDNWIAATARAWGLPLVSRDAAFARVPRLRVVRY